MIQPGLIVLFLLSFCGTAQEMRLHYEDRNASLNLAIVEKKYSLDYTHNFYDAGTVDLDKGLAQISDSKIILISDYPVLETNFTKLILKRKKSKNRRSAYFIGDDKSIWKVVYVKNRKFKSEILSDSYEEWMGTRKQARKLKNK